MYVHIYSDYAVDYSKSETLNTVVKVSKMLKPRWIYVPAFTWILSYRTLPANEVHSQFSHAILDVTAILEMFLTTFATGRLIYSNKSN